jgi:hypothetical protein
MPVFVNKKGCLCVRSFKEETKITKDIRGLNFKNNKTGCLYYVIDFAINSTNAQDGQNMVIYKAVPLYSPGSDKIFCREFKEFINKFTEVYS